LLKKSIAWPMLMSEMVGSAVFSTNTWRASRRRRVPSQVAQERLLMNFASSSRTALDSVSL
jgi:hypothetical protein